MEYQQEEPKGVCVIKNAFIQFPDGRYFPAEIWLKDDVLYAYSLGLHGTALYKLVQPEWEVAAGEYGDPLPFYIKGGLNE